MIRYAFRIEYNGAGYAGWQQQRGQKSVQEAFEAALSRLDPSAGRTVAAGRTDSGVHALGQVVHVDLDREWHPFRLCEALNAHLRFEQVRVLDAVHVNGDFSARFSACRRIYAYRILCRRAPPSIESGLVWHVRKSLDAELMIEAAGHLVGRHDFTTFRSAHCQSSSSVKTLESLEVGTRALRYGTEIKITATARSFLHRQVRSMVGSLERVGAAAILPGELAAMLAARNRSACGPVAPPEGLYLEDVEYDPDPFAPAA